MSRDPGTLTTLEWIDLQAYLRSSGKAAKPDDVITVLHALPGQVLPRYIVYWGNDQLAQLPENTGFYSGIDDDPIEAPKPVDGQPTNYDEPYVLMESGNLFVVVVHGEQHRVRAKDAAAALRLFEQPRDATTPTPGKP